MAGESHVLIACDAELEVPAKNLLYVCEWYCPACKIRNLSDLKDKPEGVEETCSHCGRKSKITAQK